MKIVAILAVLIVITMSVTKTQFDLTFAACAIKYKIVNAQGKGNC